MPLGKLRTISHLGGHTMAEDVEAKILSRLEPVIGPFLTTVRVACDVTFAVCKGKGDACLTPSDGACVLSVDDPETIPAASVLHELMHAERYYRQNVPQLVSSKYPQLAATLENELEHLWILPRQRALGHPSSAIQAESNARGWKNFLALQHQGIKRKRTMMLLWFEAHAIGDAGALSCAREIVKGEGQLEWAEELWIEFHKRMSDKVEAFNYFLQQAEIDASDFGYYAFKVRPAPAAVPQ